VASVGFDICPRVSIIVLAKNCEKYILGCIGSIVPNINIEIIIVDPGSSDRTSELVVFLESTYPDKIRVVRQSDNSPAEGLNNGIRSTTGEIIGILNGDDVFLPGSVAYVQEFFSRNSNLDILLMGGFVSNELTAKSKLVYPSKVSLRRLALARYGGITFLHQGMFVKKNFASDTFYNTENRVSWDFEYLVDLVRKKPNLIISRKHAAVFRIHPESISGGKKRIKEGLDVNSRISNGILGRPLNVCDQFIGLIFRIEKYFSSAMYALADTVFLRNKF
jgi:glycosyltransferase involved in cell wall biosynthesis